jgi:hypothetical protein
MLYIIQREVVLTYWLSVPAVVWTVIAGFSHHIKGKVTF